jgi:hypothetical protein
VTANISAGSRPIDMVFDRSSRHLYVLNAGTHTVVELDREADGSLVETGVSLPVPTTAVGLVAPEAGRPPRGAILLHRWGWRRFE